MIIALGSDHAGFELRQKIKDYLLQTGCQVQEFGAKDDTNASSYVEAGKMVSEVVSSQMADAGIVICGTGIGISIVANKHKGIRCALCTNEYMARMARQHNNANVLALGARVTGYEVALAIVKAYLEEAFEEGGRHQIRVDDIEKLEKNL